MVGDRATLASALIGGRYRLRRRLGTGGMAGVYLADDERLGRPVAIKRLPSSGPEEALARFRREVRLGASLNHPNVVSILDSIAGEDELLIVMEYVEGEPLSRRLEQGALDPTATVEILRQVAAALDHAHSNGVIHRDVKPSNILLRPDGVVKLADLGIATAVGATRITSAESVIGTLAYIAPERLSGEVGTPAADIYSLASVAFEALSGRRAQQGETPAEVVARATREEPPDIREAWPEAPAAMARALREGMHRDPRRRPVSATDLIERLEEGLAGGPATDDGSLAVAATQPLGESATPSARRTRWLAAATVAALLAAVAVAIGSALSEDDGEPAPQARSDNREQGSGGRDAGEERSQTPPKPEPEPTPPTTPPSAAELNDRGYALIQQGAYDEAIPILQRAVELSPPGTIDPYAFALFNLGNALRLAGRPEEAIPILEQRLQIPNQTEVVAQELELARAEAGIGESGGTGPGNGKRKAKGHKKQDD